MCAPCPLIHNRTTVSASRVSDRLHLGDFVQHVGPGKYLGLIHFFKGIRCPPPPGGLVYANGFHCGIRTRMSHTLKGCAIHLRSIPLSN